jgi:Ca-activated chloride channel homolog
VALTIVGPLPYEDGEATFRLPLVVAPRYIPGTPLDGEDVGAGHARDTDTVPDASRITPPVLLPGFPNPVRLHIGVDIDPAGLVLGEVRSSLHTVTTEGNRVSIQPGERANRDFVLRLAYGQPDAVTHSLTVHPDVEGDEATFRLTLLPPTAGPAPRPKDVVLLLDRSGSMQGWKMVAARRAAARIVDTLGGADRFAVLTFDHAVDHPPRLPKGLVEATDRNRFRAVEHLAGVDARGGTELLAPLKAALALLPTNGRDRVVVLVTDGQVGNEDQILSSLAGSLDGVRVHTVGIDQAVNAGFLGRLAAAGGGRCELVESEDRLDEAMERIHRRVGAPLVTGLVLTPEGLAVIDSTIAPAQTPDLFPGVPTVVTGRCRRSASGAVAVRGRLRDGAEWSARAAAVTADDPAATAVWARAHLRELEDRYVGLGGYAAVGGDGDRDALEGRIVETSLRFGVLCRFTAWLAVDSRVVTDGGEVHRVVQPVEPAAGWDMLAAPVAGMAGVAAPLMARMAYPAPMAMPPMPGQPQARSRGIGIGLPWTGRAPKVPKRGMQPPRAARRSEKAAAGEAAAPGVEALAAARRQAADEARRLRAVETAPEYERREQLADLGSRLDALVKHLAGLGVDAATLSPVRDLADELAGDRPLGVPGELLAELWARTLRVLDAWASGSGAGSGGGPGGGSSGGSSGRGREFWKRRP